LSARPVCSKCRDLECLVPDGTGAIFRDTVHSDAIRSMVPFADPT
jgi:hypothetical protein